LRTARQNPAAQRILDIAERLAQTRGFNGFSYADIAEELAVTKASLHYHFPSKSELGRALIVRYQVAFGRALQAIDVESGTAAEKLKRYIALYDGVLRDDRMCLCGMFAAEYATLPKPMQQELRRFFDASEVWLARVMADGQRAGDFALWDSPDERARVFLGALEGAMLVARSYRDDRRFRLAAEHLLADLQPASRASRTPKKGRKPRAAARRRRGA
jgi:TetR/AcrR family transcriptional regulator, transcriptional repressor for nem operon